MDKPCPIPDTISSRFWEACNEGILLYQECTECQTVQPFPRSLCVQCNAERASLTWRESARIGTLTTFSMVHRGPTEAFKKDQPYLLALVELNEGFRLMVNLLDCEESDLEIGMAMTIVFEKRGATGQYIPQAQLDPSVADKAAE